MGSNEGATKTRMCRTKIPCEFANCSELNSTVSKILSESLPDISLRSLPEHFQPILPAIGLAEMPVRTSNLSSGSPPPKVQRALLQWAQQNQQAGIHLTRAMIRQEAASLAAITWTPQNSGGMISTGLDPRSQNMPNDSAARFAMMTNTPNRSECGKPTSISADESIKHASTTLRWGLEFYLAIEPT